MARYRIELKRSAAKEIEKISNKRDRQRIVRRIARLATDARPAGCEKLTGSDHYRIRQGHYRIIYAIEDKVLVITVVKIGHRRRRPVPLPWCHLQELDWTPTTKHVR